jgi:hypothetical protein
LFGRIWLSTIDASGSFHNKSGAANDAAAPKSRRWEDRNKRTEGVGEKRET